MIVLFEMVGNADNAAPEQIAGTCVNDGFTFGIILTVLLPFEAH